jgi:hypothetical protein
MHSPKRQLIPEKESNSEIRKSKSLLPTEINLTNISYEDDQQDYFLTSSIPFRFRKLKLAKASQTVTNSLFGSEPHNQS